MSEHLIESIERLSQAKGIMPRDSIVLVAVSGGQDSCALLHALTYLAGKLEIQVHAAHFNHQLRGEESNGDEEFVRSLAASLSVPFHAGCGDIKSAARRLHESVQEAARRARFAFLEETARQIGAQRIALGHTRDDHIETVLLNIIRGTGLDGLRGLRPMQGNRIRPLLEVSRSETGEYCQRYGIEFREDASNKSLKYLRNRVREELLPLLGSYYNPAIGDALVRLSQIAGDESDLLNAIARSSLDSAVVNRQRDVLVLCTAKLREFDRALVRRVVLQAIGEVRGNLADIDQAAIESIVDAVVGQHSFVTTLVGSGIVVRTGANELKIERCERPASRLPFRRELAMPGVTCVPELGLEVVVEPADRREGLSQFGQILVADETAIQLPLAIRGWRTGDRIRSIGMAGDKKLQDIFVDRKVPISRRGDVPVIEDAEGPIWVVGHAIAERVRARESTVTALRLEVRAS